MSSLRFGLALLAELYVLFFDRPTPKGLCPFPYGTSGKLASRSKPFTILVEGNAGCGKSTFLDAFKNYQGVAIVPEPVREWQNVSGTDLLDLLLAEGERWTGLFQMESTLSRLKLATKIPLDTEGHPAKIRIMERSLYSERYCYLNALRRSGKMTMAEFVIMDKWFQFSVEHFLRELQPDYIVYLRCDMHTLRERIVKRNRPEEAGMDMAFVEGISRLYDDWLLNGLYPVPARVLTLNASSALEEFEHQIRMAMKRILPQSLRPLKPI